MPEAVLQDTETRPATIRLIKGDITELDVDAFVFYASPGLALGSGIGTAISARGGPSIQKELADLGPLDVGEAVVSAAGDLKANWIIHAVGPRFQEADTPGKLRTTMRAVFARAEAKGVKRLAFPAMGAGYYGVPNDLCAEVMLDEIHAHVAGQSGITDIVICVLDTPQFVAFERRLPTPA
jgi:O-acetyl-ADP-ribose deacetylase (regulator of RNase III)